jgi:hypothetical protein
MVEAAHGERAAPARRGLLSRIIGVVLSPRETFEAVAAQPRWLGVMAVVVAVIAGATVGFMLTETGRQAALDAQVRQMEAFGMTISDEMYAQMERRVGSPLSAAFTALSIIVFVPVVNAIIGAILFVIFNAVLGGSATFKQLYAVLAHVGVIGALQQLFAVPVNLARGSMSNPANLAVFVPMLDESSFVTRFLGMIDLFYVWQTIVLGIGLAVLYRRRAQPIIISLLIVYAVVAGLLAFIMSRLGGS